MENLSMENMSKIISFIVLVITAGGLIISSIRRTYAFVKKYWDMFNESFEQLAYVYKELKPNHGSSIYDKITKISEQQKITNRELFVQSRISRQIRDDMKDVMYCEFTETGDFVFANKKLEETTGLQSEEMFGTGWLNFICESDRHDVYAKWKESLQEKTPFTVSFCIITKDNSKQNAEMKMQQIRDASGNVVYFVGRIIKM